MKIIRILGSFMVLAVIFSVSCKKAGDVGIETPAYLIEYFPSKESPQISVIVGLGPDYTYYGKSLRAGLRELSKEYEIGDIDPILNGYNYSSPTKELIVHIKKKEAMR